MTNYWPAATRHLNKDKVMKKIIATYKGEIMASRGDAFYTLARSIAGQQISVKAADSVWKKVEQQLKKVTPRNVLKTTDAELRSCGLSGSKVMYMRGLAEFFATSPTDHWHDLEDDALIKELIALKGIGRWTAEMFLIFHMARPDVFPIQDIGMLKAIERHYGISMKDTKKILKLAESWRPYRTVATWYLWRSLDPVAVAY